MSKFPLAGITVADFTWIGAGSYTTKILADFGADVIKIESTERIDTLRDAKPFQGGIRGLNRSGYFADRNSSKRSVTLNLKSEEGRKLAREIIAKSDVVANNFTPGTMEKFGLGYEAVREFKKDLVYISMSMHGQTGPESKYLGYGLTMGAVTGLHHLCGRPELDPAGTGTNFPDHVPNPAHSAFAILAALRHRRRTGVGQFIDVAQIEPTIALLGPAVLNYTANGVVAGRVGNQHITAAPHGVYPTRGEDRWIAISAPTEAAWSALTKVLEHPALGQDARFRTSVGRWEHREALDALLSTITAGHDAEPLAMQLQHSGVAAAPVHDAADVLRDPQLQARGHWVYLEHPEMGRTVYNALPFRMSRTPGYPNRPAPLLGEHTDEVLKSMLGLKPNEIEALRSQGALQ
ncbi:CoA transferase [Variovorax sp. J22P240]|uniref:CaiB/BaiF CoA transferase family protein n=1 Tax=Variovorax sp. J22P240 TaxID=3053514 RepID=UPI002578382E|nr:CoA transferase [Variovorax sp. J22P240]MDM0002573.1 CoA transferase [Variovorax sp. J22P240]